MVIRATRMAPPVVIQDEDDVFLVRSPPEDSHETSLYDFMNSDDCHQQLPQKQNGTLRPAIESMMSEMSKAMKHIRSLIQQRSAERVANSAPESTSSAASECVICREPLYASNSCTTMCGHVFHVACMHQLGEYRGRKIPCPVCRDNVHVGELIVLRTGLPDPPATEPSGSGHARTIDLTIQDSEEQRTELDHLLTESLRAFEHLCNEQSVFLDSTTNIKKQATRKIEEMKHQVAKSKSLYQAKIAKLKEEREKVQDSISRIAEREERLEASQRKYNQNLIEVAKKSSDLAILEEKMKAEKKELEQKSEEFESMLKEVKDKERRLERLRHALDAKRKTGERKRSVSYVVDDSRDTKKSKTQSISSDTRNSQESPFFETLRLPSAVNRPSSLRRPGGKKPNTPSFSLSTFVPKRPGIHRPSTSVAKRKIDHLRFR
ncbi:unnamed protein product [Agarophyton chilense]|eukprot:gb/GEZJ01001880.1/.p1 GENE.gb/GEZJ01001880.1/~~gb/GEZJ01001880.1/.p1  ORF type:complete len:434 (+),score=64.49 gb/GEZJ01001880.1/:383-1684(+)